MCDIVNDHVILDILHYREAWKAVGDSSSSQAMQEYIALVKKLDPGWNPQVRLNDYIILSKNSIFLSSKCLKLSLGLSNIDKVSFSQKIIKSLQYIYLKVLLLKY